MIERETETETEKSIEEEKSVKWKGGNSFFVGAYFLSYKF